MSKRCFRNSLLILAALFLVASASANERQQDKREPMLITSARMEADKLGDAVTFTGDVILKREGMTLYSDSMTVYYDKMTKGVRKIEAVGNVVVRKDGRVALSNKASYYNRDEKIVLTGDARIIENENQLGGERITLFMRDDRSIVEGGKVLFYQEKDKMSGGGKRK